MRWIFWSEDSEIKNRIWKKEGPQSFAVLQAFFFFCVQKIPGAEIFKQKNVEHDPKWKVQC